MANDNSAGGRKRKRGAPPGNTNALKHGFYSKRFKSEGIKPMPPTTAKNGFELDLLRLAARRVYKYMNDLDLNINANLDLAGRLLGNLGMTASRIAALERAEKMAQGEGSEILRALDEIHMRVLEERELRGEDSAEEESQ